MKESGWALALLALLVGGPSADAAGEPRAEAVARFVVIVGNNQAFDPSLERLRYADDDAVAYYRVFTPFSRSVELLTTLDDESQRRLPAMVGLTRPPTAANLREALARAFAAIRAAQGRTELVFVFAGHGGLDSQGKGYLHLLDGAFSRSALFRELIAASPATRTHLILDSCNAFSLVAGRGDGGGPSVDELARFLAGNDLDDYPSVGVLAAASEDRETHEWSKIRSGVFSHQVRSALTGAADVNGDGLLEYSEIAAFVDAANAGLRGLGKQGRVFAWPPRQDRRAAVLDIRSGVGVRYLTLGAQVEGALFLELESGERWAELNKIAGEEVSLFAPADALLFLRDEERELRLAPGAGRRRISGRPSAQRAVASRGAVDSAFERGLFTVAFGKAYYQGFLSGRDWLVPVPPAAGFLDVEEQAASHRSPWRAELGYSGGSFLLRGGSLENGGFARLERSLGERVGLGLGLDLGHASLAGTVRPSAWRLTLTAGPILRIAMGPRLALFGAAGLGWGALEIDGARRSADISMAQGQLRAGLEVSLFPRLSLSFGAKAEAALVTLDGEEVVRGSAGLVLGLGWRL